MRSESKPFLRAKWLDLAMLNYEIDPGLLEPHVPAGTELDHFEGRTLVSMVGFCFFDTKVLGVPIPLHRNFEEVNLRFYVRRLTEDGARRGVVFIKEIVPSPATAWVARTLYNENYVALSMKHDIREDDSGERSVSYGWRTGDRWNELSVATRGPPYLAREDSEETFITEHYWGYVQQRDGRTVEYQVEHPRWTVRAVSAARLDIDTSELYGAEFADALGAEPTSAFLATGSEVTVRKGQTLAP